MKSAVTSYAVHEHDWQRKLWQGRFYDHVIRNEEEYYRIDNYIMNNVRNWQKDHFHP